jgi:hypothetical protein
VARVRGVVAVVGFLSTICAGGSSEALARSANSIEMGALVLEDPTEDEPVELQLGLRFASATPNGWGADVCMASAPRILPGGLVMTTDFDVIRNVPLGDWGFLSPRVGATAILGSERTLGLNAGVGIVTGVNRALGVRVDVVRRDGWLDQNVENAPQWSITAGLVFFSKPTSP